MGVEQITSQHSAHGEDPIMQVVLTDREPDSECQ